MKLKDGSDTVPTVAGFFFSIFLPFMLISYSYQKFDILLNKKDAKIFTTDLIDAISDTEVFDTTMGLKIAIAFTEFPTKGDADPMEPMLDKSFGRIAFYREAYGFDANNNVAYEYVDLPSH